MKRTFHLKCSCGRDRDLPVEDIPPQWLEPTGRAIRPQALALMKCLHCGARGAPAHVELLLIEPERAGPVLTPIGMTGD